MDIRKAFGFRNWFIKNAIFDCLLNKKDYFGIDNIRLLNKGEESIDVNILYKLCNLVVLYTEAAVNRKDIMAVLYKISFTINDIGRLKSSLTIVNRKEDYENEAFEESMRMAEEYNNLE